MVVENVATFKVHKVKDGPYQDEEDGMWWLLCWVEDCNPVEDIDGVPVPIDDKAAERKWREMIVAEYPFKLTRTYWVIPPVTIDDKAAERKRREMIVAEYPELDEYMFDEEIPFSTFTDAYNFKKHFESSIDPILIEFRAGMEIKYDG